MRSPRGWEANGLGYDSRVVYDRAEWSNRIGRIRSAGVGEKGVVDFKGTAAGLIGGTASPAVYKNGSCQAGKFWQL